MSEGLLLGAKTNLGNRQNWILQPKTGPEIPLPSLPAQIQSHLSNNANCMFLCFCIPIAIWYCCLVTPKLKYSLFTASIKGDFGHTDTLKITSLHIILHF